MNSRATTTLLRQLNRINITSLHHQPPHLLLSRLSQHSCRNCQRTYLTLPATTTTRPLPPRAHLPSSHRTVFIQTSPTPNDHALKFIPTEHTLLPPNTPTVEFLSTSPNVPSPL